MSSSPHNKEFLNLLEQHKKIIFKVCNSYCKDHENRKDLAQEIVIQLWKSFHKYDKQFKVSTWIYRIALNVAISFYRREKKHTTTSSISENTIDVQADNQQSADTENNIVQLHYFIDQLDELHKALMILYLDNNSYKDISEVLGISETNVATKVNRIKQKLKEQFQTIKNKQS
jgi:RNA polymerase sigma-70 factor (ECF subfamily)